MRRLFFSLTGLALLTSIGLPKAWAEEENEKKQRGSGGAILCRHPDCEKMNHTTSMGPDCRSVVGHGGTWNQEKTHLDVCANCQKEHDPLGSQCQPTEVECRKKRPVAN